MNEYIFRLYETGERKVIYADNPEKAWDELEAQYVDWMDWVLLGSGKKTGTILNP